MYSLAGVSMPVLYISFGALVLFFLLLDLGVFHRKDKDIGIKEALAWTLIWFIAAMGFNWFIWQTGGAGPALEFFTGYILEKSLSFDNLFVILLVFTSFGIAAHLQHRALFWGIVGALVLRGVLIGAGSAIINAFHWVFYIFGAFLLFTGIRMFFETSSEVDHEKHIVVRAVRHFCRVHSDPATSSFFHRTSEGWSVTILFLTVLVVEVSDVIFALDSIPAIFAITTDPFIVWTSNVFAILGLRSLYFVVARMHDLFSHLKYGLGVILLFIGGKMLVMDFVHVPVVVSLAIVLAILVTSIITSVAFHRKEPEGYKHE